LQRYLFSNGMKKLFFYLIITQLCIQSFFSLQAQNTEGTEFWLTYGRNRNTLYNNNNLDLQIRVVGGKNLTKGTMYFTNLDDSVCFTIPAHQRFNHTLTNVFPVTSLGNVYYQMS